MELFDYATMTEECKDYTYIDGSRPKTGSKFFTPILPPVMDVLKKYDDQRGRFSLITFTTTPTVCFRSGSGPLAFKRMKRVVVLSNANYRMKSQINGNDLAN